MPYFDQRDGNYDRLKKYCEENGLLVGHILNNLIDAHLHKIQNQQRVENG